jgi:hypothetical protein
MEMAMNGNPVEAVCWILPARELSTAEEYE